jgi:hypothetical protein
MISQVRLGSTQSIFVAPLAILAVWAIVAGRANGVPLEGFLPLVGIGLTDEFQTVDGDGILFFMADSSPDPSGGNFLGVGGSAHYDVALIDTGANGSLITDAAYAAFDIVNEGFSGSATVQLGGATGTLDALVNDPLGIYATGLENRTGTSPLTLNSSTMIGQTSVSLLSLPPDTDLPNILGLPFASQYVTSIQNDRPQIFELAGKTVRTPQIDFLPLGSGGQGILRRAPLMLLPGASFVNPPAYIFDYMGILEGRPFHDNPTAHTLHSDGSLSVGGMFVSVDVANNGEELDDSSFFFDTGASVTVISELNAVRLGFDPLLDDPEFTIAILGSGGTAFDVPGFFVDEFTIETVGGTFTVANVPVLALNVTDASNPINIVDGIVGMNLFAGRNLVIDPQPSLGGGGNGPQLYIGDPVTSPFNWVTTSSSADWSDGAHWDAVGPPDQLGVANLNQVTGTTQEVVLSADVTVWELNVAGTGSGTMTLRIDEGDTLTTFSGVNIKTGGEIKLAGGTIDTQFIDMRGGILGGSGTILTGSGPIAGQVENLDGRVEPGDGVGTLNIEGRYANTVSGVLAIEIGGTTPGTEFDQLIIDGDVSLAGTLEVLFVGLEGGTPFAPAANDSFEFLTATGARNGTFDTLLLPSGFGGDLAYTDTGVILTIVADLAGDYNQDGTVDASDYTLWRDSLGSAINLAADGNGNGTVDQADYIIWKNNFSSTANGSGRNNMVPEPSALLLVAYTGFVLGLIRARPAHGLEC